MFAYEREQKATLFKRLKAPPQYLIFVTGPRQTGKFCGSCSAYAGVFARNLSKNQRWKYIGLASILAQRTACGHLGPTLEKDCRNALLSDLEFKLKPLGIDAQPEVQHADEMRSDIRVAYAGSTVPIEKKSCSRGLWSGIENQLIAKCARHVIAITAGSSQRWGLEVTDAGE